MNKPHVLHWTQQVTAQPRETHHLEQHLGQLQAQLHSMPMPGSAEYRFSLATTRQFAQALVVDLVSWLHETEPSLRNGRQHQ